MSKNAPHPPFESILVPLGKTKVAMDLLGPLPKPARGHNYKLVVHDNATQYPESFLKPSLLGLYRELFLHVFPYHYSWGNIYISFDSIHVKGNQRAVLIVENYLPMHVCHPETDGLVKLLYIILQVMVKKKWLIRM